MAQTERWAKIAGQDQSQAQAVVQKDEPGAQVLEQVPGQVRAQAVMCNTNESSLPRSYTSHQKRRSRQPLRVTLGGIQPRSKTRNTSLAPANWKKTKAHT